jgi:hypothetical protein
MYGTTNIKFSKCCWYYAVTLEVRKYKVFLLSWLTDKRRTNLPRDADSAASHTACREGLPSMTEARQMTAVIIFKASNKNTRTSGRRFLVKYEKKNPVVIS